MKISIPKERRAHERRVAATPETVKKFIALGIDVAIEAGAGEASRITDAAYEAAGATIVNDLAALLGAADIVISRGSATFLQELAALKKPVVKKPAASASAPAAQDAAPAAKPKKAATVASDEWEEF